MFYPHSNIISFYSDFVHPILRMIGLVNEIIPRSVRKVVKPKMCFDVGKKLTHDQGSIFLFEEYTIIRIVGWPQPPHISSKYVPMRLGFVDIFQQLISLNREYLGRGGKKGTFLCRCTKVGDFEFGKNAIEESNAFLKNYKLPIGLARTYDPFNVVRHALKNMT